ncbi:MAG: tRNA (N(6)-L-threonylcarbamoyladenosine(37)-C(2))-methylthiotransferase [Thermoplasmatota archaeon]
MKYYVESYGCTLNQGETEMFAESLEQQNTRVDSLKEADTAVIGTCVVIEKTEERMKRRIEYLAKQVDKVIITGCLAETSKDDFDNMHKIKLIPPSKINFTETCRPELIGILPIASGCLGSCSYCITKLARGYLKSWELEKIKRRFENLLNLGTKEIRLTCQDTASYGLDINTTLPKLLERLLSIEGDYRIRIGMMNPDSAYPIIDDLIEKFKDERIYKFLHLPLQSGSDKILNKMNRKYDIDTWKEVVNLFRNNLPHLTLSTDIIVGFPGESKQDFEMSKNVLKEIKPDIVNVTRFSARPGTSAFSMDDKIHSRIKKKRSKELTNLRFEISKSINENYVNVETEAVILGEGKEDSLKGRLDDYKVIVIPEGDKNLIGKRVKVKIISAEEVYLVGEPLSDK